jgi:biotin-(acetyl-CoA carboxylase) ligase
MLDIDVSALEQTVADAKAVLKDGLAAIDIWDRETGLSLAGHNPQPEAVALFNQLTNELSETLSGSGFPALNRYYMLDLLGGNTVVVQKHGDDLLSGMLLDASRVNLGILVSVVIPRVATGVEGARNTAHQH